MSLSRRPIRAALAVVLTLLAACTRRSPTHAAPLPPSGAVPTSDSRSGPPDIGDGWRTASPEAVGLDAVRLAAMTEAIRRQEYANVHAVLIEKDGRLVYEQYFAGVDERHGVPTFTAFTRDTAHHLRSVSKSVVSALVGTALASGAIRSLDQPLLDFFPEHAHLATPEKRRITIRHALTMSAGLEWNEHVPYTDPRNDEVRMNRSADPIRFVLERPVVEPPGSRWNYNGGLTHLLALVVERATGRSLVEYAKATLFEPLGIMRFRWFEMRPGILQAASGLILRPRDLAKFGSLYLHEGRWNGRQVLPADWIAESTRRRLAVRDSAWAMGTMGYGYQWWHLRLRTATGTMDVPNAAGNGEQRVFVLPALGMVVTINAGRYDDPSAIDLPERLLVEHILPAVRAAGQRGVAPAGGKSVNPPVSQMGLVTP